MNLARAEESHLAALVDRAREVARSVPDVDAFEIRADQRLDSRVAIHKDKPLTGRRVLTGALGVRVIVQDQSAYAHTADPTPESVRDLVTRAAALARAQARRGWRPTAVPDEPVTHRKASYRPRAGWDHDTESEGQALDMLKRVTDAAKEVLPAAEGHAALGIRTTTTLLTDSLDSWVEIGSLLSTTYTSVAHGGDRLVNGTARQGGELDLAHYATGDAAERLGRLAAERAEEASRAVAVPSGRYRVLCDNELSGTLAHESFGHLTEHDLVSSGWSMLQGRRGETLAAEDVSVTDAPVVDEGRQGVVVPLDDQGTQGEPVRVLDRGVLRRWLHTRESAREAGDAPGGNGRALTAAFPSIVRMRNTYFEPGTHTFNEALAQLDDGLYLCGARGGAPQSDGSFMFTAIRGYLVKNGRIEAPVRTAAIHGNILDFLRNVECLTRDFEVSTNYFGGCGKRDQSFLHVGVGGPHVLVRDALVGASG